MKCVICGNESGKYKYCRQCYAMHSSAPKPVIEEEKSQDETFLYEAKHRLLSSTEEQFYSAIKNAVPSDYNVFPQINLASIVEKTGKSRYRNELFRNLDFLVTDNCYAPKIAIEINDNSHLMQERRERDQKVQNILEEAGIPLIRLWTSYGVNQGYITEKIQSVLAAPNPQRIHHFTEEEPQAIVPETAAPEVATVTAAPVPVSAKKGCYIATCVYGSYDCPEVWVLRRFRDYNLSLSAPGRLFIRAYYFISPTIVRLLGNTRLFTGIGKHFLDKIVHKLMEKGYRSSPYQD